MASIRRWNPLLGEWVIYSPASDIRPWSGAKVSGADKGPDFDPGCYLCPGVKRASGEINPAYDGVYVFDNDFPSLSMQANTPENSNEALERPAHGICRVVCFSPRHNITLAEMENSDIYGALKGFGQQYAELSAVPEIEYITEFENKGKMIGVSNPHPHGQIYAAGFIPRIPMTMYTNAEKNLRETKKCLFCELLDKELGDEDRIVCRNEHFVAYVPFTARYKYEVHIVPLRHFPDLTCISPEEFDALADIYQQMLVRYDNLFRISFPNITIIYNAPCKDGLSKEPWHFHIAFFPPLRSADKMKYLAGFETGGGNIINPSMPETSAHELRSLSAEHYLKLNYTEKGMKNE